jgi:hypothetical protein
MKAFGCRLGCLVFTWMMLCMRLRVSNVEKPHRWIIHNLSRLFVAMQ